MDRVVYLHTREHEGREKRKKGKRKFAYVAGGDGAERN